MVLATKVKVKRIVEVEVQGLGSKIQKARKASGETVETLAQKAGITRQYWYDVEKEYLRDGLPEETLRSIEKALDQDLGVSFND